MTLFWKKPFIITITAVLLSACQHENPLKTAPLHESSSFLINASANAEKRLHFTIQKDAYGFAYLGCMEGKKSYEIHCDDLYQGMLAFARENHYSRFKTITLADLTNQVVFQRLADDYAETVATTWPQYFSVGPS